MWNAKHGLKEGEDKFELCATFSCVYFDILI
jgi:hypothetical protein